MIVALGDRCPGASSFKEQEVTGNATAAALLSSLSGTFTPQETVRRCINTGRGTAAAAADAPPPATPTGVVVVVFVGGDETTVPGTPDVSSSAAAARTREDRNKDDCGKASGPRRAEGVAATWVDKDDDDDDGDAGGRCGGVGVGRCGTVVVILSR